MWQLKTPVLCTFPLHLQNFVVAGGSPNGTIAVITLPLSYVRGSPGQSTTLTLDAQNSSPRPGTTLTQWVWAVITLPDKRAVTNATGRITQVRLRPGVCQVSTRFYQSNQHSTKMACLFIDHVIRLVFGFC